jgi:DNA-binding NtrC family response regulator
MHTRALADKTVLIIEDESVIAMELEEAVSDHGGIAVVAATFEQAQNAIQEAAIDGAIVDLRLQGQSVRPLISDLSQRRIRFVFHTGIEDTPTLRSIPAAPSVTKPADPNHVIELLIGEMRRP